MEQRGSMAFDSPLDAEVEAGVSGAIQGERYGVRQSKVSVVYVAGSLAGGNFLSMLLRLAGGVLQARCVAPTVMGLFNSIGLIFGYAPLMHLGVLNGLCHELPRLLGKGDARVANEMAAASEAWAMLLGSAAGLILLAVAGWQLVQGELTLAFGWFTNAMLAMVFFYNAYLQMTYRTSHDFVRLAYIGVLASTVGIVLVPAVAALGFYGLCLRALGVSATTLLLLHYYRPLRVKPRWNLSLWTHLLLVGAPILGVGYLYSFWSVVNSTLVLRYAGTEGMGLYAIVTIATTSLEVLPLAVEQVIYPRMAEQFGRTGQLRGLAGIWWKPMLMTFSCMIPVTMVAQGVLEPVVRFAVPAYLDAVPAIRWSILLPLLSSLLPVNSFFNVARRQDLYVVAILIGMGVYGVSLVYCLHGGSTLSAFPQAMLIGRIAYLMTCFGFLRYLINRELTDIVR